MSQFRGSIDLRRLQSGCLRGVEAVPVADRPGISGVTFGDHTARIEFDKATTHWAVHGDLAVLMAGAPRFGDSAPGHSPALAWLQRFATSGPTAIADLRGPFALVIINAAQATATFAIDRFGIQPLCYSTDAAGISFGNRADDLPGRENAGLELQSLYRYLYFHIIPAPETVFRGISRVDAGYAVSIKSNAASAPPQRYWVPKFVENQSRDFNSLKEEFRGLLRDAVTNESRDEQIGAFLSGGTDSSTVSGMLTQIAGKPAKTYSMGFEAEGYDEMEYARIAAKHFGTEHHEYYVTPADLLESIPKVAKFFDQPFGNSSAVPSYLCAQRAAQDGITKLLAGDGGDELFGGNSRYAKQAVFETYFRVPSVLRAAAIEPALLAWGGIEHVPVLRKARSYVAQAKIPLPGRMNTYNLLERIGPEMILSDRMLAASDQGEPARQQARVYAECAAGTALNRMLAYDWKYTLADCDLPKVCGAVNLANMRAGFPLLDENLLDFSLRLEPSFKLKGLRLRWFFKEALRGFLPDAIITKKKHGFGLPFGVWAVRDPALKRLASDSVSALVARGIVRESFGKAIISEYLPQHPGYYGEMVWILMILEQWLSRRMPDFRV